MLHKSHKLPALLMAGAILLSFNSCGLMEMRDCYVETVEGEASADLMLAPAERVNQVVARPETEVITEKDPVVTQWKAVLTGDVLVDSAILKDAADGAYEGQSYSFLTMYTGLYGCIHGADAAMMSYSTAGGLADHPEQIPPVESIAALSDLGADVLDTTGSGVLSESPEDHGMLNLSASDGAFELLELDGVTFGYTALTGDGSIPDDALLKQVEDAAQESDITVVTVEWTDDITGDGMRTTAHALAAAGADVIVGRDEGLGTMEWIDNGDGTPALAAYSLGNILSTSGKTADLIGGVLTFTVTAESGGYRIESPVLEPTITHYTAEYRDYQVFRMAEYSDELAARHANSGIYTSVLGDIVRGTVPAEFLPAALRG
ncbi:MAG: CapA family protein [Clostridia bacterium]|nr:CapA family protein [Clostridia bacterium]